MRLAAGLRQTPSRNWGEGCLLLRWRKGKEWEKGRKGMGRGKGGWEGQGGLAMYGMGLFPLPNDIVMQKPQFIRPTNFVYNPMANQVCNITDVIHENVYKKVGWIKNGS